MWDVVSFFSLPPSSGMSESPAVCIARVLLLPSVGTWSLVHHGFCTLWTVFKTYCVTRFLLALVAPFSRGCVSALLGEYVPSFPQGVFKGFRIRRIHLKSVPAHQTHARFALINNVSILESWLVFRAFFHDLGRIHASLSRLPRCSEVTYLGLVVF